MFTNKFFSQASITTLPNPQIKRYALITVRGQKKLACLIEDEWIIDSTCKSINNMLADGFVGEEAVIGWAEMQPSLTH
ncbi:hypothetical protein BM528_15640 [Alteromonas sp. RW2A1]|uniref:hypothetical protein n=1 Tax=Alteromonas sp. RW2A1 TaxID=1917158 RepID=UPI0009040124|nr:hypothetical protein [Alteromonas sp. RW2A1]APE07034.1 hypothetical protein BM528_15640 [Alteromonas sp. RW2A1]